MITKKRAIFDIASEKYKYLQREGNNNKKVNMLDLNARLNRAKKLNFNTNAKIITLCVFCLTIIAFIDLKF